MFSITAFLRIVKRLLGMADWAWMPFSQDRATEFLHAIDKERAPGIVPFPGALGAFQSVSK